jgi:hypothetical protein
MLFFPTAQNMRNMYVNGTEQLHTRTLGLQNFLLNDKYIPLSLLFI